MKGGLLLRSVTGRTLRDAKRSLIGYGIATAMLMLMMGSVWPSIELQGEDFQKLVESYPPAMQAFFGDFSDLNTAHGYMFAEAFSAMLPLILLLFAIGRTADTLAGEEERGAMDALLTHPVSRRRVFLEKLAGVALGLVLIAAMVAVSTLAVSVAWNMGLRASNVAAASLILLLFALAHAGVAAALAGWRGRKGLVIALTSAVAVASYVLSALGKLVDWLEEARYLSLFRYYGDVNPLRDGLDGTGALVLASVALVGALVGLVLFERRDVAVG